MLASSSDSEKKFQDEKNVSTPRHEYHAIIILFAVTSFYRQVLVYDTLAQQNIVQAGGISVDYGIHCIFQGTQYPAVAEYARLAESDPQAIQYKVNKSKAFLAKRLILSIVIIMPIWTIFSIFLGWKLKREMAWKTFRKMDADLVMQHKYRTFQVSPYK